MCHVCKADSFFGAEKVWRLSKRATLLQTQTFGFLIFTQGWFKVITKFDNVECSLRLLKVNKMKAETTIHVENIFGLKRTATIVQIFQNNLVESDPFKVDHSVWDENYFDPYHSREPNRKCVTLRWKQITTALCILSLSVLRKAKTNKVFLLGSTHKCICCCYLR